MFRGFLHDTDDYIDASVSATSTALMAAPDPVAKAAGAGIAAGQLIDKTLDVSDHSSAAGVRVYEKLKGAGVNDTAAFVIGGVATVAAIPTQSATEPPTRSRAGSDEAWHRVGFHAMLATMSPAKRQTRSRRASESSDARRGTRVRSARR